MCAAIASASVCVTAPVSPMTSWAPAMPARASSSIMPHVCGPTIPSGRRPWRRWNSKTAVRVPPRKWPSTVSGGLAPSWFRRPCRNATSSPSRPCVQLAVRRAGRQHVAGGRARAAGRWTAASAAAAARELAREGALGDGAGEHRREPVAGAGSGGAASWRRPPARRSCAAASARGRSPPARRRVPAAPRPKGRAWRVIVPADRAQRLRTIRLAGMLCDR